MSLKQSWLGKRRREGRRAEWGKRARTGRGDSAAAARGGSRGNISDLGEGAWVGRGQEPVGCVGTLPECAAQSRQRQGGADRHPVVWQTDPARVGGDTRRHLALGGGGLTESCTPRLLQERICLVMPTKKCRGSQSSGQGGLSLRGKKGVPQSKKKEGIRERLQMGISLRIRGPAVWVWGEL